MKSEEKPFLHKEYSEETQEAIKEVLNIIRDENEEYFKKDIFEKLRERNMRHEIIDEAINALKKTGDIYEAKEGRLRKTKGVIEDNTIE